eukprot:Protomagalhaensia_wolfi_Nauph_80__567@NODE_1320_length_1589_cov_7_220645_g1020_i0_p1_GENE_NODE_1320_length_1589_cov_7_220645_g1020_i0NODE_1320_length_1589_cov_7_220645_g1020_i0_p1_ORF_typecomplete_len470_score92_47DUF4271/PF14093_6/0_0056Peptidase_A22B/PF04258_13/0_0063AGTRAP/PF06396_11/0_14GIT_CC/PF16559_5/3_1e03GIT_CC/PF16559_5/48GIT_CC/PF16559_5/2_3XRCC4/PF06632_12/5_7XRCC4/PF06632_12/1_7e02APG6_N/PF17675_1/0_64APG6_N/PF17675_1/1_2e03DHR10/PF18595_1/1_2e04DHR10/PF18595_1/0_23DHR10/PF18595_1/9
MSVPGSRAFLEAKTDDFYEKQIQFGATIDLGEELVERRSLQNALGLNETTLEQVVSLREILDTFATHHRKDERAPEPSLFKSLYSDAQKSNQAVTWRSFLNTVFKQRRELKNKMAACNNELKVVENNEEHCEKQLKAIVSSTSTQTQLEEKRLIVQVLSVEVSSGGPVDLLTESDRLYKVSVDCHGQFSSTASRALYNNEIYFNELHAFSLPKAEGPLEFTLHATSITDDSSEALASGQLDLVPIGDQLKHRLTVNLAGTSTEGTVVATLQWIKSKVSFYERHIHHYAVQRSSLLRDLQELQSKLDFLELSMFGKSLPKTATQGGISYLAAAVRQPEMVYSWAANKVLVSVNASNYEKATQTLVVLALLFNCLTSFTRVLYLDALAEGFAFWCNLDPVKRWDASKYMKVSLVLLGSIVFDIFWLYYNVRIFRSPESDMSHLTTLLSILNVITKILLIVFLCHSRSRLRL